MTMLKHPVLIIILKEIKTRLDHFFERPIHQKKFLIGKLKILRHLRKAKGIVSSYIEYDAYIHVSS